MCCNQPSPPAAPDYTSAAEKTAQGNLDAARLNVKANRPTQITPWGTSSWSSDGNDGWTQNVSLTPQTQSALNAQQGVQQGMNETAQGMLGQVNAQVDQPFDMSKVAERPDLGFGAVEKIRDAMLSRLRPSMDLQREQRLNKLRTQGITPGATEAWGQENKILDQKDNDMEIQALLGGMQSYNDITSREMQGRQQDIQEQSFLRSLPVNELNAILRGNTVGMPQFSGFSQQANTGGADYLGAAGAQGQAAMDVYNTQQGSYDAMMQGLFGLAGSGAMAYGMKKPAG